ncbi:hypothetical protein [Actinomadura bangladeshensis]|nr:hypothetical protein [Actinomadura bangladeshensis]
MKRLFSRTAAVTGLATASLVAGLVTEIKDWKLQIATPRAAS